VLIGVGVACAVMAAFMAGQHRREGEGPDGPPASGAPPQLPPQPPL
jgi:hypothetical protein